MQLNNDLTSTKEREKNKLIESNYKSLFMSTLRL